MKTNIRDFIKVRYEILKEYYETYAGLVAPVGLFILLLSFEYLPNYIAVSVFILLVILLIRNTNKRALRPVLALVLWFVLFALVPREYMMIWNIIFLITFLLMIRKDLTAEFKIDTELKIDTENVKVKLIYPDMKCLQIEKVGSRDEMYFSTLIVTMLRYPEVLVKTLEYIFGSKNIPSHFLKDYHIKQEKGVKNKRKTRPDIQIIFNEGLILFEMKMTSCSAKEQIERYLKNLNYNHKLGIQIVPLDCQARLVNYLCDDIITISLETIVEFQNNGELKDLIKDELTYITTFDDESIITEDLHRNLLNLDR